MAKTLHPLSVLVNANIKAETARHDVTDQQILAATGMSIETLRLRRSGRHPWTLAEIAEVAPLVGVHPSELLK